MFFLLFPVSAKNIAKIIMKPLLREEKNKTFDYENKTELFSFY